MHSTTSYPYTEGSTQLTTDILFSPLTITKQMRKDTIDCQGQRWCAI